MIHKLMEETPKLINKKEAQDYDELSSNNTEVKLCKRKKELDSAKIKEFMHSLEKQKAEEI